MTATRVLVPCVLTVLIVLAGAVPSRADAATAAAAQPAVPAATAAPGAAPAPAPAPGSFEDTVWAGPGGIYRVVAASAGVLAGAGAMSVFIDGWVVDSFMRSSGMTMAEAAELVQDFDSQGGFEAAAILLAGLAGGLIADHLYVKGVEVLPGALDATSQAMQPPLAAAGSAWGWVTDRAGDGSDWVQARSRELWDRWQQWTEHLFPAAKPTTAK
jgi:hypothetical protein